MKRKSKIKLIILSSLIILFGFIFYKIFWPLDKEEGTKEIDISDPNIERAMQIDRLQRENEYDSEFGSTPPPDFEEIELYDNTK